MRIHGQNEQKLVTFFHNTLFSIVCFLLWEMQYDRHSQLNKTPWDSENFQKKYKVNQAYFELLETKPRALIMAGKYFIPELQLETRMNFRKIRTDSNMWWIFNKWFLVNQIAQELTFW